MSISLTWVDVGLGALGLYLLQRVLTRPPPASLPPGPKGLPLVGNVADMPTEQEWKTFAEWGQQYGDIICVKLLGQPMIILNSAKLAYDMLDKKSAVYSDRPSLMMGSELVGWKQALALTQYGERFRTIRKMLHRLMGTRAALAEFHPVVELESHRLLRRILESPEHVADAIRKTAGAIILRISHGYPVKEGNDPIVHCVDHATEQFSLATQPGAFLVDVLPIMRHIPAWFPGAGFQRKAAEWRKTLTDMADVPHNFVKTQMAAGIDMPNFTSKHLSEADISATEEDTVKWAAASLYSGGADTTVSATYVFFLAMTLYPEAQAKAQAEIDAVIGTERLPVFADRERLPYVEALVKEVFRWQPVVPLSVPHRLIADDIHEGYFIPKGSIIITNIWHILHNEDDYPDPMAFRPERFLKSGSHTPQRDPRELCFGFGRRICPGLNLADASVWLACVSALAVFRVSKARDAAGREIGPEPAMTSGTISHPHPFQCTVVPRSKEAEALVRAVE